ncbi:MAG: four helix bundle protein [Gammaproteobacteria bacterium]|nr:four helix bundle protein [Gammaproteobacteria bacterium]
MKFEDMDAWKRSSRLSVSIYRELSGLTDFGFKDQITRSGLSIPSNIAEGFGRESNKEKRNFMNYAKGSCAELRTQIYIGMEIGYICKTPGKNWIQETYEISAMLTGIMKYLKNH